MTKIKTQGLSSNRLLSNSMITRNVLLGLLAITITIGITSVPQDAFANTPTPDDLVATPISDTEIDLTWTHVGGSTSHIQYVERCEGAGCNPSIFVDGIIIHTDPFGSPLELSYSDTGLTPDTTYGYRVFSTHGFSFGISDTVYATTLSAVDEEPPVITLVGLDPVIINLFDVYVDDGATALDDVDGDITGSIVAGGDVVDTSTHGSYVITYNVMDLAGNSADEVTRTVTVLDNIIPEITLIGDAEITLQYGTTYVDDGATALDVDDGDLTSEIVVGGLPIDTFQPLSTWIITYDVSDSSGNDAEQVTRTVKIGTAPHKNNPLPRPTFGIDMNTNVQAVDCGFELNNQCYTLTDKWHTPFEKVSLETGTVNNIELNVMAQMRLKDAGFCLVPQVGSMEGEVCIGVSLDGNGEIVSTSIDQDEPIVDEGKINFSVSRDGSHYNIKINNVVFLDIPFYNVVGLYAVDYSPSATEQFLNEGIGIFGQSFVEQPTIQIASNEKAKYGDSGSITLTRVDKFANIWTTDGGILYTFNEYGTPSKVSPDEFVRHVDLSDNVMTRSNSNFVLVQNYELDRALEIMKMNYPSLFAEESFSELGNIKSIDYPDMTKREQTLSKLNWD